MQVPGIDFKESFTLNVKIMSFRMLVALATSLNLELHHLDIQTTLLHGELDEEVYPEIERGVVRQLRCIKPHEVPQRVVLIP